MMEKSRLNKKNKIETFYIDFLNCEKDEWNSGSIFYISIAKRFHL